MREARARLDVNPVAIHASYLINLCSQTESVRENSVDAVVAQAHIRHIILSLQTFSRLMIPTLLAMTNLIYLKSLLAA